MCRVAAGSRLESSAHAAQLSQRGSRSARPFAKVKPGWAKPVRARRLGEKARCYPELPGQSHASHPPREWSRWLLLTKRRCGSARLDRELAVLDWILVTLTVEGYEPREARHAGKAQRYSPGAHEAHRIFNGQLILDCILGDAAHLFDEVRLLADISNTPH